MGMRTPPSKPKSMAASHPALRTRAARSPRSGPTSRPEASGSSATSRPAARSMIRSSSRGPGVDSLFAPISPGPSAVTIVSSSRAASTASTRPVSPPGVARGPKVCSTRPWTVLPRPTVRITESRRSPAAWVRSRTVNGSREPSPRKAPSCGESAASRLTAPRILEALAVETLTTASDCSGRVRAWSTTASTTASTSAWVPSIIPDWGLGTPRPLTTMSRGLRPCLAEGTISRTSS